MTTPPAPPPPEQPPPPPPPPPGGGPPPPGYATNDEKTWALLSHFGGAGGMFIFFAVGGWVMPLIALVTKGKESPTVRQHAVNALNFQITWSIAGAIGYLTACLIVGIFIFIAAGLVGIIFGIIGGMRANEGQLYEYPLSIKMIK